MPSDQLLAQLREALLQPEYLTIYQLLQDVQDPDDKDFALQYVHDHFPSYPSFAQALEFDGWDIFRTYPAPKAYGRALPIFIRNGSYYYSHLGVYQDGSIDCWGFVDLDLFKNEKLRTGWVQTSAPDDASIGIHNLGMFTVDEAQCTFTSQDLLQHVHKHIQRLNPSGEDLLDMQGTDVEDLDGIRTSKMGLSNARPLRKKGKKGKEDVLAKALPIIAHEDFGLCLRHWLVYADGNSQISGSPTLYTFDQITDLFAAQSLSTTVPDGQWLTIPGIGRFLSKTGFWSIDPAERIREARDELSRLQGNEGSISLCIQAHHDYQEEPNDETKEALRIAYEAVPEHLRIYCGDMDSKDRPIRRIIYDERYPWEDDYEGDDDDDLEDDD